MGAHGIGIDVEAPLTRWRAVLDLTPLLVSLGSPADAVVSPVKTSDRPQVIRKPRRRGGEPSSAAETGLNERKTPQAWWCAHC